MNQSQLPSRFELPTGVSPAACVDIGGTKIAVSIADSRGLRGRVTEATAKTGKNDAVAMQVIRLVEHSCELTGIARSELSVVGVSSCGPFTLREGMVELAAPNICAGLAGKTRGQSNDWRTASLEAPLREVFRAVRVENDAIAALEAERRWGALQHNGQPLANCAYVTWSTGIGMGLCVDGHTLRGKNGNAGHGGHSFVSDDASARCGCGNVGDVEGLVAGSAVAQRFGKLGYADSAKLLEAAVNGDDRAKAIVDEMCRVMGRALYNLVALLDLQCISIGGGVFWNHREHLLPTLQQHISGKLPALTDHCRLVPAGLGEHVGDFGALALVAREQVARPID